MTDILGDGSILKTVMVKGSGLARPPGGSAVTVHYVGKLDNGAVFDSSRDRGEPFTFKIGDRVIPGWNDGIKTMAKGERATFVIQPEKAYGAVGAHGIPANSTLSFDIELIDWPHGQKTKKQLTEEAAAEMFASLAENKKKKKTKRKTKKTASKK